jgi:hypothetical protein
LNELIAILFVVIIIARFIGSAITESKKRTAQQLPPEEEPESPYSVPPSTMEGPIPRRTARPQMAQPRPQMGGPQIEPQRTTPGRVATPTGAIRTPPAPRRPKPRVVRRVREFPSAPEPDIRPVARPPEERIPAVRLPRPAAPAKPAPLHMHDDPVINGIIWAEILGRPRCYSSQSWIAGRR